MSALQQLPPGRIDWAGVEPSGPAWSDDPEERARQEMAMAEAALAADPDFYDPEVRYDPTVDPTLDVAPDPLAANEAIMPGLYGVQEQAAIEAARRDEAAANQVLMDQAGPEDDYTPLPAVQGAPEPEVRRAIPVKAPAPVVTGPAEAKVAYTLGTLPAGGIDFWEQGRWREPTMGEAAGETMDAISRAFNRGWLMDDLAGEMEAEKPDAARVQAIQREMQKSAPSPEFKLAMDDRATPEQSWQAFKSAPVRVLGELMVESLTAYAKQMFEKAPARVAIGTGAGAAAGAPIAGIGAVPGGAMGATAGFAQASGASSYALEMSGGILEALEKAGVNLGSPEELQKAFDDPERMQLAREFAAKKAVPVALFDTGSALIAGRLVGAKPATVLAKVGKGAVETSVQAVLGMGGEASGQLAQSGQIQSGRQILAEGVGELGPGAIEVGVGAASMAVQRGRLPTGGRVAFEEATPTGTAPAAGETTAPAPEQVEVVGDDVFGEPTTAAMERPVATGDERFAPPAEERTAGPAVPTGETAAASAGAGTTASVPVMITRQMEADLLARGYSQQDINRMTPQQANEILAAAEAVPAPAPRMEMPLPQGGLPREVIRAVNEGRDPYSVADRWFRDEGVMYGGERNLRNRVDRIVSEWQAANPPQPVTPAAVEDSAATRETASGVDEATNQNYGGINEVGISENASRGDAANPLESAASFTRSRAEAIRAASPSRKGFSAEFEAFLEWGQREGVVTDQAPVQGEAASKGREHEVWLAPEGRVFKATYPQQFGLALSRDGKATPVQYLERIALNNEFFGDAIRIERLWNENGRLRVVTSQPFVNGQAASDQQIESFFNDLGFTKQKRGDREFFYNEAEGVVAFDTHGGNVLSVDGKVIPIDVGMQRVTPELAAALDLTVPSTADAQAATTARRNIQRKLRPDAGAIDLSIVEDLVQYGRTIYRAGMDYATWAAAMTREFGQAVAQFLRQAFDRIVAAYQASRFSDTTGAVGDVRPKTKPRQFEAKARQNEALAPETRARLGSEYIPISLNAQAEAAKEWINTNGLEAAKLRIAQLSGNDTVPTPLDFAIGIEAAGRLSATGDHAGAAGIVSTMSQRATSLGQTISVLSMMARLTPEGIVLYGQNIVSRYINTLPQEAQDRIKALQAEVDRLRTALADMKFKEGSEVIRSGKLGDEKIQDRIKRRVKARVQADLGPAAAGPEVTAETKARTQGLNRKVRDVLLSDAKQSEMVKQITQILTSEGNMAPAEAEAVGKSIVAAFTKIVTETRRNYVQGAKRGAGGRRGGFDALLKLLGSKPDMTDAEFVSHVSQLMGLPGMTPELARELRALAQRYEKATDPDIKLVLGATLFERAHEVVPVDFWVKVRGFAYLSMLFAPKTWIRNVIGNQIQWIANVGRDAVVSGVMDPLMSLFTGQRTTAGLKLGARLKGLLAPIEDVRKGYLWSKQQNPEFNFRQNFMAGVNHLRMLAKLTTQNKFEIADVRNVGARIFSSKLMRAWEGTLSIALGAGDRAFWMSQFRASLAQMQAAAEKNGEWTGQPTPEMIEAAMAEAAYAIYQNPNIISANANKIRGALNRLSTFGKTDQYGLGTGLMAFTQVPGSITLRGLIEWSPLGMIPALYRGMRGILYATAGGRIGAKFDQAAFNKEFTQALLGTGTLYAAGYYLYALGIVTASREDDDDLEAMRRASGKGAYRINLTALRRALLSGNWFTRQEGEQGDVIVPYDWAQPLAITFAAGAELAAQVERSGREQLKKGLAEKAGMAAMSLAAGAKSLEELPLLSGLSSFIKTWGYAGPLEALTATVAGMPSQFVPQLVRQAGQINDNLVRETRGGDTVVQREFMKVLASVPGYSTKFPVRFDITGQAIQRYQYGGNSILNVFFSPAMASEVKRNPVLQEVSRLVDTTGETSMVPRQVKRSTKINGVDVDLTNEQLAAYSYYLGNFTMSHFAWRMAAPVYARLPDEMKVKMLAQDITDIDAAVKSAVLGADPRRLTRNQMFLRQALVNSPLGQSVPPR